MLRSLGCLVLCGLAGVGCSVTVGSSDETGGSSAGGAGPTGTGGASATGGASVTGGASSTGGASATGGASVTGGSSATGGAGGGATGGAGTGGLTEPVGLPHAACADTSSVAALGPAWSSADDSGPDSHGALYGAIPRFPAVVLSPLEVLVAWQPEDDAAALRVSYVSKEDDAWALRWSLLGQSLGQVAGLAAAGDGDPLLITASDERIAGDTEPNGVHRDDIMHAVRFDGDCTEAYRVQLRTDFDGDTSRLPLYSPMTAGTGRLAVAGDGWILHYSQNTEYDGGVSSRHQIGRYLVGSVDDGSLTAVVGDISHSFDQRVVTAGAGFVSLSLGDASLRGIEVKSIATDGSAEGRTLFAIKGGDSTTGGGYNNTFTRLGQILPAPTGYVAAFATEETTSTAARVNESRNLAWVHLPAGFATIEQPEKYVVTVTDTATVAEETAEWDVTIKDYWASEFSGTNRGIVWLTTYDDTATEHVERPKVVALPDGHFLVLWEQWTLTAYTSTYAMVVDEWGATVTAAVDLGAARLPRGDDAFAADGGAAWFEGTGGQIVLHLVTPALAHTAVTL